MVRRAVFVTGAAAGISRAIATRFAAQGWAVGLYDVDGTAVAATADAIYATTVTGAFNVTDPAGWTENLAAFVAATGRLDVLVNNAGVLYSGALTEISLDQHARLLDVNIKGVLTGCYCALPHLRRTPGARMVNTEALDLK